MTSKTILAALSFVVVTGCGASTSPAFDATPDREVSVAAGDDASERRDASADRPLFEDGAECRLNSPDLGERDCWLRRYERFAGPAHERYVCCAGRCFQGTYCAPSDPSEGRCDLAEVACGVEQVCCEVSTMGRANCVSRSNQLPCTRYVNLDAGRW